MFFLLEPRSEASPLTQAQVRVTVVFCDAVPFFKNSFVARNDFSEDQFLSNLLQSNAFVLYIFNIMGIQNCHRSS